jgi:hypothetical protein
MIPTRRITGTATAIRARAPRPQRQRAGMICSRCTRILATVEGFLDRFALGAGVGNAITPQAHAVERHLIS